jgi:pimeloyl-ACP methyl ester carboxylesterase
VSGKHPDGAVAVGCEEVDSLFAIAKAWTATWHVLLVLVVLGTVFVFLVVPWFLTRILTGRRFHYPDPNDGKTPISYGLNFRWIEFQSPDGILLKGWYIPAPGNARGTIIYCHGLNRTRTEMLPRAVFAHGLGYNGLLFDFRHAGQSGGETTTLGYQERLDVLGAARYALQEEKAARPVIAWGVSMGAAAALMAAADSPDVAAVISDSTFLSLRDTVQHHLRLFLRLPAFPLAYEVMYWAAWRGGFSPSDLDLEKAVERIGSRPILFIAVEGDRRMPPAIAWKLYSRAASPAKQLVVLPGQRHGEGFNQGTQRYQQAVSKFLADLPAEQP